MRELHEGGCVPMGDVWVVTTIIIVANDYSVPTVCQACAGYFMFNAPKSGPV